MKRTYSQTSCGYAALKVFMVLLGGSLVPLAKADNVPAGSDMFITPPGCTTFVDLGDPDATPIPADFFGPGSDPFAGLICLKGVPLVCTVGDSHCKGADTIVERLDNAILPIVGSSDMVDIQIRALHLVSENSITVTFGGPSSQYDVEVFLSEHCEQRIGSMTITHEGPDGGTFTSQFSATVKLVFTKVGAGPGTQTATLDPDGECVGGPTPGAPCSTDADCAPGGICACFRTTDELFTGPSVVNPTANPGTWSHFTPAFVLSVPAGDADHDGDGFIVEPGLSDFPASTDNFHPGIDCPNAEENCFGGLTPGVPCQQDSDCGPPVCVGGCNNGMLCEQNADCVGPPPGSCQGICIGGENEGNPCELDENCGPTAPPGSCQQRCFGGCNDGMQCPPADCGPPPGNCVPATCDFKDCDPQPKVLTPEEARWADHGFYPLTDNPPPPPPQLPGACCDHAAPGGVCREGVLPEGCVEPQEQFFKGLGCGQIMCEEHTGACCDRRIADPTLRCRDGVTESLCIIDDPGQVSWIKETSCVDLNPPCTEHTGACCVLGVCTDNVTESQCTSQGSEKWYKDTPCSDPTVDAICDAQGGIPTVSEWGLVILALTLLVGAKVYYRRRKPAEI